MTSTRKLLALPLLAGFGLVGFAEVASAQSAPIVSTSGTIVEAVPTAEVRPGDARPTSLYGGSCHEHQMVDLENVSSIVLSRTGSTAEPFHVRWEGYGYLDAGGPIREHLDITTIPAGQRSVEVELPVLEGSAQLEPHTWMISISETPEYDHDITVHGFTAADPAKDAPCELDGDDVIDARIDDDTHLLDHIDRMDPPREVIPEDRDAARPVDGDGTSSGGGHVIDSAEAEAVVDDPAEGEDAAAPLAGRSADEAAPSGSSSPVAALGLGGVALAGAAGALALRRRFTTGDA